MNGLPFLDSRKSRSFGVTSSEESVKHKRVIQEKQVAAVEPQLRAETESGVESFEPSTDKVDGDGQFQPQFARKLQDLEVVEGSAARFDIIVKGNVESANINVLAILLVIELVAG